MSSEDHHCATDFFPSYCVYGPWRHHELLSLSAAWSWRLSYRRFYRHALKICSTSKVVTRLLRSAVLSLAGPVKFSISPLISPKDISLTEPKWSMLQSVQSRSKDKNNGGVAEGDWRRTASTPQAASMDFSRHSIGSSAVVRIRGFHHAQTLNLVPDRYIRLMETRDTEEQLHPSPPLHL